jgi:hypothetical protein
MKRLALVIITILLFATSALAQDIIVTNRGEALKVKVSYVRPDMIVYRLYDEPLGVEYEMPKSDITAIHYESGRVEVVGMDSSPYEGSPYNNYPVTRIRPGMKYSELKHIYNYKDYVSTYAEYHSPSWSGFASFLVPGLGQMLCGSVGRGLCFLLGTAGCYSLMYSGIDRSAATNGESGRTLTFLSSAAVLTLEICAIVDAVRVAKVMNMYENDLRGRYSLDLNLYPSVEYTLTSNGVKAAPGLTLALNF